MPRRRSTKPKRPPPRTDIAGRLDAVEAQIADLKEQLAGLGVSGDELAEMRDDVEELRAAVEARGATPNPARDLSPTARATRARNAAKARGSKDVGRGSGKVLTKATQTKLQKEAAAVAGTPTKRKRK